GTGPKRPIFWAVRSGSLSLPRVLLGGLLLAFVPAGLGARHDRRIDVFLDRLTGDDDLTDVLTAGYLIHHREQDLLDDGPQTTSTGPSDDALFGDRLQGVLGELQLDVVQVEQPLVLLDQGVLRCRPETDGRGGGPSVDTGEPGNTAHEPRRRP